MAIQTANAGHPARILRLLLLMGVGAYSAIATSNSFACSAENVGCWKDDDCQCGGARDWSTACGEGNRCRRTAGGSGGNGWELRLAVSQDSVDVGLFDLYGFHGRAWNEYGRYTASNIVDGGDCCGRRQLTVTGKVTTSWANDDMKATIIKAAWELVKASSDPQGYSVKNRCDFTTVVNQGGGHQYCTSSGQAWAHRVSTYIRVEMFHSSTSARQGYMELEYSSVDRAKSGGCDSAGFATAQKAIERIPEIGGWLGLLITGGCELSRLRVMPQADNFTSTPLQTWNTTTAGGTCTAGGQC
jgi:hypothetical protein